MMTKHDKYLEFRVWLVANTDLSHRSVTDIVSRLRRVKKMIDPVLFETVHDVNAALYRRKDFNEASPNIKSQLKRAAALFRDFNGKKG